MPRARRAPAPLPPLPTPRISPYQRLCALRIERGLSQAQFAELAGVRKATVVAIERGQTLVPTTDTLRKFAAALGLSLEELRRQTGMHGPLMAPPVLEDPQAKDRRWSPRAERVAGLVETMSVKEQEYIEMLCLCIHQRRGVGLGDETAVQP